MITVNQITFETIIAKFATSTEHEIEGEYAYDTFADETGEMLGLISYHAHKGDTYSLFEAADRSLRDALDLPYSADIGHKIYSLED